jgi:hypothetical protein
MTNVQIRQIAKIAGVPGRMAVRAARGMTIGTTSFLLLCSVTGIDPIRATPRRPLSRRGCSICWRSFAAALWFERRRRDLSLRDCSLLLGISIATLSRAERAHCLGVESFAQLTGFIGLHPFAFLYFTGNSSCNAREELEFVQALLPESRRNEPSELDSQSAGRSSCDVG